MSDVKALVGEFFATMGRSDWDRLRTEFLTDGSSWTKGPQPFIGFFMFESVAASPAYS